MIRGVAAGVLGTAAMTAWRGLSARLQSPEEDSGGPAGDPWEQAPAPAKVAKRISEGVFDHQLEASSIPAVTQAMHWSYGGVWGGLYGLLAGSLPDGSSMRRGLLFGTAVWAMSYVQLVPMGLYEPPWTYPPDELALDLSHHLAYGAGTGLAYAALGS